ncbi:YggT family protein [Marinospirillum sp. MEB164]|uniref:YggT family protein n=1 Tax=Marinospirillum alkalitolerans TaxID=3123374 RepID=A0ABW8PVR9_9GAMM
MSTGLAQIIQLVFHLATYLLVLRLLLHFSKADYFNPITQGVVKATNPVILPLQTFLRPAGRLDPASLVLAFLVKTTGIYLAITVMGASAGVGSLVIGGFTGVLKAILDVYFFALIISIILSWVAPQANHPGALLVYQLTEPLMAPVRRFIPSLGGLDLSPIFVFLGIHLARLVLILPLAQAAGWPVAQFIGI